MTDNACAIAAAILTHACIGNCPSSIQVPADGKLLDGPTKARDLYEFEVFKVFYNAVGQIATDPTDWPLPASYAPPAGGPAIDPAMGGQLLALLKQLAGVAAPIAGAVGGPGGAAVAGVISQIASNIPNPTVTPAPGSTVTTASPATAAAPTTAAK